MDIQNFILEQVKNNEFFKGGAIIAVLSALGIWIKSLLPVLWNKIKRQFSYTIRIESKTDIYKIFNKWLLDNHSDKYKKVILSVTRESSKESTHEQSPFIIKENNFESSFCFWINKIPIFVNSSREKLENASYLENAHIDNYTLTTYFNKKVLKNLLSEVVDKYNKAQKQKNECFLYDYKNYNGWIVANTIDVKPFDKIFNSEKNEMLEDVKEFMASKEYYLDRGIPYKRGILAEGAPGNGKTTTILSIAQLLKKDVYLINIGTIDNSDQLKYAFQDIAENSFVLLEDIDCTLNGREKPTDKINFSTVLNVIDGAYSKKGVCTFFTTNYADQLDEALTRCGRMDKRITFKNPTQKDVENMAELFFNKKISLKGYNPIHSAATIQEKLIQSKTITEAKISILSH